jgi:phage tail-like protein
MSESDRALTAVKNNSLLASSHPSFRFVVDIDDIPEAAFTECTLPSIEWEVEEVKEGGNNTYIHQLPGRRKATRLTLKNGVGTSKLIEWYMAAMNQEFSRKNVTIKMLDAQLKPVMSWHFTQAYPVKWSGPSLKASENSIAIQSLEMACAEVTISFT